MEDFGPIRDEDIARAVSILIEVFKEQDCISRVGEIRIQVLVEGIGCRTVPRLPLRSSFPLDQK